MALGIRGAKANHDRLCANTKSYTPYHRCYRNLQSREKSQPSAVVSSQENRNNETENIEDRQMQVD